MRVSFILTVCVALGAGLAQPATAQSIAHVLLSKTMHDAEGFATERVDYRYRAVGGAMRRASETHHEFYVDSFRTVMTVQHLFDERGDRVGEQRFGPSGTLLVDRGYCFQRYTDLSHTSTVTRLVSKGYHRNPATGEGFLFRYRYGVNQRLVERERYDLETELKHRSERWHYDGSGAPIQRELFALPEHQLHVQDFQPPLQRVAVIRMVFEHNRLSWELEYDNDGILQMATRFRYGVGNRLERKIMYKPLQYHRGQRHWSRDQLIFQGMISYTYGEPVMATGSAPRRQGDGLAGFCGTVDSLNLDELFPPAAETQPTPPAEPAGATQPDTAPASTEEPSGPAEVIEEVAEAQPTASDPAPSTPSQPETPAGNETADETNEDPESNDETMGDGGFPITGGSNGDSGSVPSGGGFGSSTSE